jgi:hypothetical protein
LGKKRKKRKGLEMSNEEGGGSSESSIQKEREREREEIIRGGLFDCLETRRTEKRKRREGKVKTEGGGERGVLVPF